MYVRLVSKIVFNIASINRVRDLLPDTKYEAHTCFSYNTPFIILQIFVEVRL
jgi:hypothetical protein